MKVYFEFAACASMKLRIKNIKGRKPSPRTKLNFFMDHTNNKETADIKKKSYIFN